MVGVVLGAIVVGVTLGLLGSGGSILTVPILRYGLGHPEKSAIAESLAIVGMIALAASIPYARARSIDWRSVGFFGIPGVMGTYLGAWLGKMLSGQVQMLLLAVVMLVAAACMLRPASKKKTEEAATSDTPSPVAHLPILIVIEGLLVGILTGIVGVGGGFLIVPALIILGGLPMRTAVGTSLVIIAMKSASGFYKYVNDGTLTIDWSSIVWFAIIGIAGSFAGKWISDKVDQQRLKKGFAFLLVVVSMFMLVKESLRGPAVQEDHSAVSPNVGLDPPPSVLK